MIGIDASRAKRYWLITLLAAVAMLAATIGFNIVVDPYGMYRFVEIKGFNHYKPAAYNRVRLAKAYDVRRIKPRSVILGTSRTHLGIRPAHEGWVEEAQPVYNLAFDGATTKEMFYYLRHAQSVRPLRQVVLGLDTYHLTSAPGSNRPGFDEQLLLQDESLWTKLKVYLADLKLLISFDTVVESITTLRSQSHNEAGWFAADGQRLGEIFFHQPWEDFQARGPRYYFDEIDKQEVRYKLEWRIPVKLKRNNKHVTDAKTDDITSLGYIQRIIEFCRANNITLDIFITPSHAHQMEISAATGEWTAIENGKRELVRLVTEDGVKHPWRQPFRVYDFSGYSSITTETLPAVGGKEELKHYWDSSHFKEGVGDLVLNRLFKNDNAPADFGVMLTSDNIEKALADIRSRQQAYRSIHAEDVELVRNYVHDFKNDNHIPGW